MAVWKSVVMSPVRVTDRKTGEVLPVEQVYPGLVRDATAIADAVEGELLSPGLPKMISDLTKDGKNPREVCGHLNITLPPESYGAGRSGRSRFDRMFYGKLVGDGLSYHARARVANGETEEGEFIPVGFSRTANANRPRDMRPAMNTAHAGDDRYVKFRTNPLVTGGPLVMELVVDGRWLVFEFDVDIPRFDGAEKIALPLVFANDAGHPRFAFPVQFPSVWPSLSDRFVVGVDVGKIYPATVSVLDTYTGEVVFTSTMSERVRLLDKSVKASEYQRTRLRMLGRGVEAGYHRRAASRKKRERAILIGQEIAAIAHRFDNAVVVFEELGWKKNTMATGRWDRGQVFKWTTHMVEQNGGRVQKFSATHSSQTCHECGLFTGKPDEDRHFICLNPDCLLFGVFQDRDVNAAGEMARRGAKMAKKSAATREQTRAKHKHPRRVKRRTPKTRGRVKYPRRDRAKSGPTPPRRRRPRRHWRLYSEQVKGGENHPQHPRRTTAYRSGGRSTDGELRDPEKAS